MTTNSADDPVCRFYRLIPETPEPRRADRSADGMLPMRAVRYCEAVAAASAFGWYLYPPINFSLIFDGVHIKWTYRGAKAWYPLEGTQYPGFLQKFQAAAPPPLGRFSPSFMVASREPGMVQIWTGFLARTAAGWSLLSRGPANIPRNQGYEHLEGIIETENWFGPLFTNIRITHTNTPIIFHKTRPFCQVQPLLRQCYTAPAYNVLGMEDLTPEDWQRFGATVAPNADQMRDLGHYAVQTRKRVRGEGSCPVSRAGRERSDAAA